MAKPKIGRIRYERFLYGLASHLLRRMGFGLGMKNSVTCDPKCGILRLAPQVTRNDGTASETVREQGEADRNPASFYQDMGIGFFIVTPRRGGIS
jgi:ribosomal protein L32